MRNHWQLCVVAGSLSFFAGCGGGNSGGGGGGPVATQFSVAGPGSSAAGFSFNFTLAARDASNDPVSNYSGTVHFTSSDPAANLPGDSKLTHGSGTFSATLTNAGTQTITATDTASGSIRGSLNVIAVAGEFPVCYFGAKGDGQ